MRAKQRVRDFQDAAFNQGWRISHISHAPKGRPIVYGIRNGFALISISGLVLSAGAFGYIMIKRDAIDNVLIPAVLFLAGMAIAVVGSKLHEWCKLQGWQTVEAQCVDREIRFIESGSRRQWGLRVLCEYRSNGEMVQCTPMTRWMGLGGQSGGESYLAERIDGEGRCRLAVNPKNPLETELLK